MKKLLCVILVCAVAIGCLTVTTSAAETYSEYIVHLEDMECELIDLSSIENWKEYAVLQTTGSINSNIPANSMAIVSKTFSLEIGKTVTINCSYSPSSASVDFGVIAPDGYFYFLNVEGGSINRSIKVNQSGSYAVAIRNNSSNAVQVVGFVNY